MKQTQVQARTHTHKIKFKNVFKVVNVLQRPAFDPWDSWGSQGLTHFRKVPKLVSKQSTFPH